ncbi:hypothetical protein MVEN_00145100 [Mycena venus]|uniref:Fucose-specific lectin n=1 Tax=Mycena venus TaxID=2733690 RepID=A0A8H6YW89_9AGAR|nr:hypothetical protein MVEN_00145100 [Mycena venus]
MSSDTNKVAIAAAAGSDDIRIFYGVNGSIWQRVTNDSYPTPLTFQAKVQVPGTYAPAVGSKLSCLYPDESNISLFYQTKDNAIREIRYTAGSRTTQSGWFMSDFVQPDAMPGTHIATVQNSGGDRTMIFFQDKDGYVCSRRANDWVWGAAVRIFQAPSATPIAATTWSDTNIRLYYLNGMDSVKYYNGSFKGNWILGNFVNTMTFRLTTGGKKVDSMAAVSWPGPQIRLYMHATDGSVMELSRGPYWDERGDDAPPVTVATTHPNVGISALTRGSSNKGTSVYIYYASLAKIIQQRSGIAAIGQWLPSTATADMAWSPEAAMADITDLMPVVNSSRNSLAGTDLEYDPNESPDVTVHNPRPPPDQHPIAISAMPWPGSVRVYTQNGDGLIRQGSLMDSRLDQVAGRYLETWQSETLSELCAPWSNLCCISWGNSPNDKLATIFYQTRDNVIHEMRINDRGQWIVSGFTQSNAMPGTAIAATRTQTADRCMIFFQDKDGFLCYQRAIGWVWEAAVRLCKAVTYTSIAVTTWSNGKDVRLYFQDINKQLRELFVTFDDKWSGTWFVGTLKMPDFRGIAAMSWQGPHISLYVQAPDKRIHELSCGPDFRYLESVLDTGPNPVLLNTGIAAFSAASTARTCYGRVYWANSEKLLQQRSCSDNRWQPANAIGDLSPCGGPLGDIGPVTLNQLVDQGNRISDNVTSIVAVNTSLSQSVQALSAKFQRELQSRADKAIKAIGVLAHSIEDLSKASEPADSLVALCKGQSVAVSKVFDGLYDMSKAIAEEGVDLATDITYQQAVIELRIVRVETIRTLSETMRTNEEKVVKFHQEEITNYEAHIKTLEKAKQDAKDKQDEAERLRILRDVFTLGLGEIGDWGNLKDAMNYADALISKSNNEIKTNRTEIQTAQTAIGEINKRLERFTQLKSQLDGFGPVLNKQTEIMIALADRVKQMQNHILDVGVFLAGLVGKASVLAVKHAARDLATSVLAIETTMITNTKLTGVFITNPDSMDVTLQAIANSPVEPTPVDDLI